jgi:hypothetical protein
MEEIPEGKVKTKDGQIIDRADACFILAEHKEDSSLLFAMDKTVYKRDKNGTLRRLTYKKSERMTKAERKRLRRDHFSATA